MRIGWLCALACTAAGCAQIFGLDTTSSPRSDAGSGTGDGATIDAPPGPLGLTIQQVLIGATVTTSTLDLSAQTATFLVTDASDPSGLTSVPGMFANGTWSADIPTATPTVEFTLPDVPTPIERLFAFGTRDQRGFYDVLGDAASQPAPATATISTSFGLDRVVAAGDQYEVYTVGSWSAVGLGAAAGETSIQFSMVPYSAFGSQSGRPLTAITTGDPVLALRYVGNTLDGVGKVAPFNMTAADNLLSTTITTVTADQSLSFQVDPTVPATRFAKTLPATTANLGMSWQLDAAPGAMVTSVTGPQLAAGSVATTDSGTIAQAYANPFATTGWPATLEWNTGTSRAFTPTGKPMLNLSAGLFTIAAPTAGMHLTLPQGLPTQITLAGTALISDGVSVALDPTKAVEVTFLSDATGSTFYQLQVFDLVVQNGATVYQLVLGAAGAQPDFVIPRAIFQVGHVYTLRAINIVGDFPTVGVGNLQNQSLSTPYSVGYLDSGAFTVTS